MVQDLETFCNPPLPQPQLHFELKTDRISSVTPCPWMWAVSHPCSCLRSASVFSCLSVLLLLLLGVFSEFSCCRSNQPIRPLKRVGVGLSVQLSKLHTFRVYRESLHVSLLRLVQVHARLPVVNRSSHFP